MAYRVQSWIDCDPDVRDFIRRIASATADTLDDNFCGLYLHGSLALGSFDRRRSDIDLIAVSPSELRAPEKGGMSNVMLRANEQRPTMRGIELSVVTRASALNFEYPTPFEFHFSDRHHGATDEGRQATLVDFDLASHFVTTKIAGICIQGPAIEEVFGPVPLRDYWDSLLRDCRWAAGAERLERDPVYAILTCCRSLFVSSRYQFLAINKAAALDWARANLPERFWRLLDVGATALYRPGEVSPLTASERDQVKELCALTLKRLAAAIRDIRS